MKSVWVVRAGENNELVEDFSRLNLVAYGGAKMGDLRKLKDRAAILEKQKSLNPNVKIGAVRNWAGQHWKMLATISKGDIVLTPIKATRGIMIGVVVGDYEFAPNLVKEYPHIRKVEWKKTVSRDEFSRQARNALGSTLAIFSVQSHREEIEAIFEGREIPPAAKEGEPVADLYEETKEKADEVIADRLSKIDPYDFQKLVAAVLRAMGMRTKVGRPGRDKGVDIVAHPDPLGFGVPVVKTQAKHTKAPIGAPDVRNFLATLREHDKGLFVSTGGFTQEAWEEPDKRGRAVTLLDRDTFIELLIEHYEKLEPEFQAMIPLRKLYIPVEPEE